MVVPRQDNIYANALMFIFLATALNRRRWRRRPKRFQTRPWLLNRDAQGHHSNLLQELRFSVHGDRDYKNYLRVEPAMFQELLEKLRPRLTKQDTRFRKALEPELKLAVTLRFFASGDSYMSLSYNWRVAQNTISNFVREVCDAIIEEIGVDVISLPSDPDTWRQVNK